MAKDQKQRASLRESGSSKTNMFNLRKGVRDFAVIVIVLNIANILLYNTGWIDWKKDEFDVMWATTVCVLDVAVIAMFQLLDR